MKGRHFRRTQSLAAGRLIGVLLVFSIFLMMPFTQALAAQTDEERTAKLVEGAKKEGKLVWYTTTRVSAVPKFVARFEEKYPFLKVDVFRSGQEKVTIKVLAEEQAKRSVFDVANVNAIAAVTLQEKGIYAPYLSPERKFYDESSKDAEGYWTYIYLNLNTIGYNTKLISAKEAPRTWQDLLNPKWKGKMGMDTKPFYWFGGMLKQMGEKEGLEYMKKLAGQAIEFRSGRTLNTQMLAAGEISVSLTLYNHIVEEMKAQGAPIEWVAIEPVIPEPFPISLSARAPHPNAAKLFIDFMLSREGQGIFASDYYIPSRMDVDAKVPRLKRGLKILPFDFAVARDYGKYVRLFREVVMKR